MLFLLSEKKVRFKRTVARRNKVQIQHWFSTTEELSRTALEQSSTSEMNFEWSKKSSQMWMTRWIERTSDVLLLLNGNFFWVKHDWAWLFQEKQLVSLHGALASRGSAVEQAVSAGCIMHNIQCILYIVYYTLYNVHSTMHIKHIGRFSFLIRALYGSVTYVYDLLQTNFAVHHGPGAKLLEYTKEENFEERERDSSVSSSSYCILPQILWYKANGCTCEWTISVRAIALRSSLRHLEIF